MIAALALAVIILPLGAKAQQGTSSPSFSAQPASGMTAPGQEVDITAVPPASTLPPAQIREIPNRVPFSAEQYRALKDEAAGRAARAPAQVGGEGPGRQLPDTPGAVKAFFPPVTAREFNFCNFAIPSDMGVSASQAFVVQVTNRCLFVVNPATGALFPGFPKALCSFFAVSCNDNVGDPRTLYDPGQARFIIIAEDFTTNRLLIAASSSSNPAAGSFFLHSLGMGIACRGGGDFPMAGQSLQEIGDPMGALYVSWNEFCPNGSSTNDEIAFAKTQVYSTSALQLFGFINLSFGGVLLDHVQPVNVMNQSDRPRAEFLVATFDFNSGGGACRRGCNGLLVWGFYNTISRSASFSAVDVPTAHTYFLPPNANQQNCTTASCLLNTGVPGITGTVNYNSGQIYAAISTGGNFTGAGTLFWQVHPTVDDAGHVTNATIVNEICACGIFRSNGSMYYATVQPDTEGNFTVAYNFSTTAEFPGIAYLTQRVSQAPGSFHDFGFFLSAGSGFYRQLDQFGRNRWGDYTGTAFSQTVPGAMWFSGQYSTASGSTGRWNTAVGENGYTSPSQP
jgi:hypothetical protein